MFYILATHTQSNMLCDFVITKVHFDFTAFYCNFGAASRHTVGFHCALSSLSLADGCMPTKGDNSPAIFKLYCC
jgi:hypothetical protein